MSKCEPAGHIFFQIPQQEAYKREDTILFLLVSLMPPFYFRILEMTKNLKQHWAKLSLYHFHKENAVWNDC